MFEETCWAIKGRHDEHFQVVFEGLRNAKSRFCDRVLAEQASNKAALCELDDLKTRAKSVFQKGLARLPSLVLPAFTDLLQLEHSPILVKKVVGKEDVNVSALITRLGNSDWVKEGRAYLDQSGNVCPFCQQQLLSDLASDLNHYFDESYAKELAAIDRLQIAYETYSASVLKRLDEIATSGSEQLSIEELLADIDRLAQRIELNKQHVARKKREPSSRSKAWPSWRPQSLLDWRPRTTRLAATISWSTTLLPNEPSSPLRHGASCFRSQKLISTSI